MQNRPTKVSQLQALAYILSVTRLVYIRNSDGNTNVRFYQAETHKRFFALLDLWEGEYSIQIHSVPTIMTHQQETSSNSTTSVGARA